MDESNLEAEKPVARLGVDQLGTGARQIAERRADIVDAIRDVMHPGAALGEELANRRIWPGRREELDTAFANEHGSRFDALVRQLVAMLQPTAEQLLVRVDRLVEVDDSKSEVVDTARLHRARCYL